MIRSKNRQFTDYYPNLKKKESLPLEIYRVLKIIPKDTDFARGSTFTKQGIGKILKQLELLRTGHPDVFNSLMEFERRNDL